MNNENKEVLLKVEHLKQYFKMGSGVLKAVDDVSFDIKRGEVFGLVGESGCGKTTTGRAIIKLYEPTAGDIYFEDQLISRGSGINIIAREAKKDMDARIERLKLEMKHKIADDPAKAHETEQKYNALIEEETKKYESFVQGEREKLRNTKGVAKNQDKVYREHRVGIINKKYDEKMAELKDALSHSNGAEAEKIQQEISQVDNDRNAELELNKQDTIMSKMQMIFQDPIASIDPRMTVREIISEGLIIRGVHDKDYLNKKVLEMLDLVGLVPEHADRYPHEFSGGQRQRIGIARAIALEPDLIIADEPISALDVSIQAQVINLLNELRNKMGLTILFIAHNLSVVKYFSDRIAVMYYGHIVELATSEELFKHPLHPYTKSLLSAIPYPDPHYEKTRKRLTYKPAQVHDYSVDLPSMREIEPGHFVQCNDKEFAEYLKELQQ